MMDAESDKRSASTFSPSSSSSYSSSSCLRLDRLVDSEEIEAAETLAQLANCNTHSSDKWCTKQDTTRVMRESPTLLHSDLSLGPGVRFPSLFFFHLFIRIISTQFQHAWPRSLSQIVTHTDTIELCYVFLCNHKHESKSMWIYIFYFFYIGAEEATQIR